MQRYTNSGQTMRTLIALLALTGNIGRPGAGWVYANLQSHIFDPVRDPLACYPSESTDGPLRVSISTARLGQEMLATRDPALRLAWVERGNPLAQNPDSETVRAAFQALEFSVVVEQFMTDTARAADLVLPAKSMFEQTDVIGAYWHSYIQLKQKVIEPPGEVKPETEIYHLLAARLGFDPAAIATELPGPDDAEIEAYLARRLQPFPELTLERLRQGPVPAPGRQQIAFADGRFPTPSGKIELSSGEAVERWGVERLPTFSEPEESVRRSTAAGGHAGDRAGVAPYPLHLLTPNTRNRIHSQFGNLRLIRRLDARPRLQVHPDDAAERDIDDGDRVRVFNARGSLQLEVELDAGLKAGCVLVTNGWWSTDGGAVNCCSSGRETDMGHGAAFHDNLVEIAAVTDAD